MALEFDFHPPMGDTFVLEGVAEWPAKLGRKRRVDLSGAKLYMTAKSDPTAADGSAAIQKNSTDHPAQFVIDSPGTKGVWTASFTAAQVTAAITVGTLYYVDVQAILAAGSIVTLAKGTVTWGWEATMAAT